MKKLLAIVITLMLLLGTWGQAVFAETNTSANASVIESKGVQVELNSVKVYLEDQLLDVNTILYDGRLYLPLRDMCYFLKSGIGFDEKSRTINILPEGTAQRSETLASPYETGSYNISIYINPFMVKFGGLNAYVNTILFEDTTFVSVRYISEIFAKKIEWNGDEKSVHISDSSKDIVGTVNGESITKRDFDYYYNNELKNMNEYAKSLGVPVTEENLKQLKEKVFSSVANRKILMQHAVENKIILDASDIEEINLKLQETVNYYSGIEKYREFLDGYGVYFIQVAQEYKDGRLLNKLYDKIIKDVEAKPEEVKAYYEANKNQVVTPEMVRAKHILILTTDDARKPLPENKIKEAKKKIEDILARIKAGESFDKLMAVYSEDPGLKSAPDGYKFGRGEMVPEFENAAFTQEVGKVGNIVETAYGYHIIKVEERFPEVKLTLQEAKQTLDKSVREKYVDDLLNKWWTESKIVNNQK